MFYSQFLDTKIEKEVQEVESDAEEEGEETEKPAGESNNKAYLTQSYKVKMFQVIKLKVFWELIK